MNKKNHIYVISCGISVDSIPASVKTIINNVAVLAGGKRLLAMFNDADYKKIALGANAVETIKELVVLAKRQRVAILASGDALFHGIAGTLAKLTTAEHYTVIPNITAFQALCAKLKQPWSDFELFSIHGRNGVVPWRKILAAEQSIIYCDNCLSAVGLGTELIKKYPEAARRPAVIGVNIGLDSEMIKCGTL